MKKNSFIFYALYFFGMVTLLRASAPQTIDLTENWRFRPEPAGESPKWQLSTLNDTSWATLKAGIRWEDQGFPDVDGFAWYRRKIDVPVNWRNRPVWLILGAVNDAFVLYCNGNLVNEFGDENRQSVANIPAMANLTPYLKPGRPNFVVLRVYDWGGSGGPWREPAVLTIDPAVINQFPLLFCDPDFEQSRLDVNLNLTLLGRKWQQSRVRFSLIDPGSNQILLTKSHQLTDTPAVLSEQFEIPDTARAFRLNARLERPDGRLVFERTRTIDWKSPERKNARIKILNNFVSELFRQLLSADFPVTAQFENPRNGWVFFALEGLTESIQVQLDQKSPIKWRLNPATQIPEAMLYLEKGTHSLQLPELTHGELVIRAVPEIIYSQYPSEPHVKPFGPYDWNFLTRYVLSHVNTIVTGDAPEEVAQWQDEGRKWLVARFATRVE